MCAELVEATAMAPPHLWVPSELNLTDIGIVVASPQDLSHQFAHSSRTSSVYASNRV